MRFRRSNDRNAVEKTRPCQGVLASKGYAGTVASRIATTGATVFNFMKRKE
jgi:hypothetical protein